MIVLTAEIDVNTPVFVLGQSRLGSSVFVSGGVTTKKIDKRSILSCETEIRDRADLDKPSYGVISSGGHLSFKDTNNQFLWYANAKTLRGNEEVRIFLENTITKTKEKVGSYFVSSWDYDNDNHSVFVTLTDGIEEMQSQDFYASQSFMTNTNPTPLYNAYWNNLKASIQRRGWVFSGEEINKIEGIARNIFSTTFYNHKDNLWASQNKLCQLLGLHTFINKNGRVFVTTDLNWR